ncbi:MAG: hypothetical protein QF755_00405 [Candidatus Peribacteraceae bacterium]|jgi:surface carbohydrate biosynthesis protein|nr:hypothetical protein [Candidatus Peribacteraceae bacterium]|tara:strand:+ start:1181 stop:2338 length:1158 start_codon:yes stop_codon:yes gene_type:complete
MPIQFKLTTPNRKKIVIINSLKGEIERIIFNDELKTDCIEYIGSYEIIVSIKVITRALLTLPKLYFKNKRDKRLPVSNIIKLLYRNIQLSRLYYLNPKVVLTITDNDGFYQWLSYNYKFCKFFAIQNGSRTNGYDSLSTRKSFHQTFFCFGENEAIRYKKYEHECNKFIPVGSFKASYFMPKFEQEAVLYDICLPVECDNHYRDRLMSADNDLMPQEMALKKNTKFFEDYLSRYVNEEKRSIVIAGRDYERSGIQLEESYYQSKFDRFVYFPRNKKGGSIYRCIQQANLTIVTFSTTGYEALGWGKKCLFVDYSDSDIFNEGIMPGPWILREKGYTNFKTRVDELLAMSDEDYERALGLHKKYLMASNKDNLATRKIRRYIEAEF